MRRFAERPGLVVVFEIERLAITKNPRDERVYYTKASVLDAYEVSRYSYRKIVQNVVLAFLLNGLGIPAAATGWVYPIWGMVAMAASVTTIFINSLWSRGTYFFQAIKTVGQAPQIASKAHAEIDQQVRRFVRSADAPGSGRTGWSGGRSSARSARPSGGWITLACAGTARPCRRAHSIACSYLSFFNYSSASLLNSSCVSPRRQGSSGEVSDSCRLP